MGVQADMWNVSWRMDSDELEARPGAGPDGLLDIQDDMGIAERERERVTRVNSSRLGWKHPSLKFNNPSAVASATSALSF